MRTFGSAATRSRMASSKNGRVKVVEFEIVTAANPVTIKLPPHAAGEPEKPLSPARNKVLDQSWKQIFDDQCTGAKKGMSMSPLGHAFARLRLLGQRVAFDDEHLAGDIG